nr:hypothetical protein [Tanacetum cinerariifolium]
LDGDDEDDDYDKESIISMNMDIFEIPSSDAVTTSLPVLPIKDPEDSLIMGNEELNTIPEKESDKFIKSSVEDLVPIPRESEDTFGSESVCILPSCDDFSPIYVPEEKAVTFSNLVFNSNDDFISSGDEDGKPLTCCECEGPLRGGFCWFCDSRAETSLAYDPNPDSFDDSQNPSDYPPQPQYETYLYKLCGNDSHYGYDCPPRFPFVYEQEPSYNPNYDDNYYPHNSPSFLCCENCEGPHESFQCQPMNQNYFEPNSSGFDQPPQYFINHQPSIIQEDLNLKLNFDELMIEQRNELFKAMQSMFEEYCQRDQAANLSTHTIEPSRCLHYICYDDSLIMGNEELNTIPEKELDEFINSSVEYFILIPSESEDTSGSDSECILPSCDDFSPIDILEEKAVTFSNPLFNSNDDFISSDDESLSDEDVLEDIECKDSYDPNLDESTFLVTPLSNANEDECFNSRGDVDEINDFKDGYYDSEGDILYLESLLNDDLVHHDPSIPAMNVASILEGSTDEPPLEENHDLFDLESKNDDWKKILYDALILMTEDKCFDLAICVNIFSPTYDCPDFEDSRARGFVHHPLELQSLAYENPIS